jgi:hypothetical protein
MLVSVTGRSRGLVNKGDRWHPPHFVADGNMLLPRGNQRRPHTQVQSFTINTNIQNPPPLGKNYDVIEDGDTCRDIADRNKLSLLDLYVPALFPIMITPDIMLIFTS